MGRILKTINCTRNRYLAFGYGASATGFSNPDQLKMSRRVELELDFTGYTQLYVFAIAGNDNNGGERPNNVGEGLYCEFSNGETLPFFPICTRLKEMKTDWKRTKHLIYTMLFTLTGKNLLLIFLQHYRINQIKLLH
ncbi:MAG: hypothetical protein CM15mV3_2980 [Caudoviricetes sp.]|nr:MAG: hypothetical protein CM15mV3_2980 [Caudoviricetes sp.]